MTNYNLDDDAILTEVKRYELDRDQRLGRLFIDIHRVVTGEKENMFLAVPNLGVGGTEQKYITKGSSEEEVLISCLNLIRGVPASDIIPILKSEASNKLSKDKEH